MPDEQPKSPFSLKDAVEALRIAPLWILAGLTIAAAVMLWFSQLLPPQAVPWLWLVFIPCAVLSAIQILVSLFQSFVRPYFATKTRRLFITTMPRHSLLHLAKQADKSINTQISARILVRNLTPSAIRLTRAALLRPRIPGEVLNDMVLVQSRQSEFHGPGVSAGYEIAAGDTAHVSVHLMIRGTPKGELGPSVVTRIAIYDDEGNSEKFDITIRVDSPAPQPKQAPALEAVHSIKNPIEKAVAAALQSELAAYERHGRSAGGLGSVHLVLGAK